MKIIKFISVCLLVSFYGLQAQTIDQIIAVVDESIVLKSEWDAQYKYMMDQGEKDDGSLKCIILESLLSSKLLLAKARLDSLSVGKDQIDSELDRRLGPVIAQFPNDAAFKAQFGKTPIELKDEMRPKIEEQLLADQQKSKIFEGLKVTPKEVKDFYNQIPKDSIPYLPAEVEIAHLVIKPKPSQKAKDEAKEKLHQIRKEILDGKDFGDMAKLFSMDEGSKKDDGNLGEFTKGQMVSEFEEVAFSLKEGQISEVFESPYGYHVIKMHRMLGDRAIASHILLIPEMTSADEETAKQKLINLREAVIKDSLSFPQAAMQFSDDAQTKNFGGSIMNPMNGEHRIPIDQLESDLYLKIDKLKEGEISEPLEVINQSGGRVERYFHVIWLKKKHPPHLATLETDYNKFQQATMQSKQAEALDKWFTKAKEQVFIEIKTNECNQALENWK